MMSIFDHLSVEEKEAIEELKRRISDQHTPRILSDETIFYRFLKARDFDMKNAEKMIRKHFEDRKLYKIDTILDWYKAPEHYSSYIPITFLGYDKEGSVIRYVDVGSADHKGLVEMIPVKQFLSYIIHYMEEDFERMTLQSKQRKKLVCGHFVIFNMDKLNLFQATFKKGIEYMITGLKFYQDNDPERLKLCYIINASHIYMILFSFLKKFIASTIFQKIHIFGTTGWQEELLEKIDADVLPAFLGGTRTDPDGNPRCDSFVNHGKRIPEHLYSKNNRRSLKKEHDVKQLIVSRLSCSEIEIYVVKPTSTIEWEFEVKSGDIAFGLSYKTTKESTTFEELIPKQKIDTESATETGIFLCNKIGIYILLFDNSLSWIHSKEIYYRVRTIKPEAVQHQTN